MSGWFTAAELAGLPGLPNTDRGVQLLAKRESWKRKPRPGKGGGRLYPASVLPPTAQAELARRAANAMGMDSGARIAPAPVLLSVGHERLDARLVILRCWQNFRAATGLDIMKSQISFAVLYNGGEVEVEPWVSEQIGTLSVRTLRRWAKALNTQGPASLNAKYGNRKGTGRIESDPDLAQFIIAMLVGHPHVGAKHVLRGLRVRYEADQVPPYRTVQRFIANWKRDNAQALAAVSNPDAYKGKYLAAIGNAAEAIKRLNQCWELDSTLADLMLADGRYNLVGVIDVYSRRVKLLVSKTSKSSAVAALLRRAILDWGVPEQILTDNGKDYTSRHISRVAAALEIDHKTAPPFSPEKKPHIERALGSFSHGILELAPGFIGHNVAERKDIEARRSFAERFGKSGKITLQMSADELQAFADKWAEDIYAKDRHSSLGRSPFEAANEWRGPIRRIEDERALDVLLAEAPSGDGWRTVGKKGISVEGAIFIHEELGPLVGDKVQVRFDPTDLGRVYVFDSKGTYLCVAVCSERVGTDRREIAIRAKAKQRQAMTATRKELRALARDYNVANIAEEILDHAGKENSSLVPFPQPAEPHETPALDEAAKVDKPPKRANPMTSGGPVIIDENTVYTAEEEAYFEAEFAKGPNEKVNARAFFAGGQNFGVVAEPQLSPEDEAWVEAELARMRD